MSRDLGRLLRPRSIAVLGSGWAANVVEQCRKLGFQGEVWPVHPTREQIAGAKAFPSLAALPGAPDACFVGVNRHATIDVMAELSAMGGGGAICFASGFRETGDGELQERLVAAAGEMPFLGPNCYGVLNYLDGAGIWPDQHGGRPVEKGVALVSQSSNIAINLTMQKRGLPVAYVACLGNAAQTGLAELSAALLADDRVTALGLYVEGIGDAAALAALAEDARARGKGIVCLKAGRTVEGARAAATHTASLAGEAAASSAFFAQAGIGEVQTLPALLETLKILHVHGPLGGRRVCSLSCSGGEAALVSDTAGGGALSFPPPAPEQAAKLAAILGPLVSIANPLDYQTFIWGDAAKTEGVFTEMLRGYDAGIYVIDPPRRDRCDPASYGPSLHAIEVAGRETGVPAFPVATIPETFDEDFVAERMTRGVAALMGLPEALAAVAAASQPAGRPGWRPWPGSHPGGELMSEVESKAILAAASVPVPVGVTADTLAGLDVADLAPPFVLKGMGFAHKSEAGAVRLGVVTLDGQAEMPGATGYLAEEMVTDGVAELLVGLRRDLVMGATLTLGIGGVTAELLRDTVTLVLPVTGDDIANALARLRLGALLTGYRGRPAADTGAAAGVALKLQALLAERPDIAEIELNPLILRRRGAVAVDALIRKEAR